MAAELFAEHGYDSTTVRMIANALGVKAGSLYYHIESKDEVLFNVIDGALDMLSEPVQRVAASDLPPTERLRHALATHITVGCATRNEMIVTARETDKLSPERADHVRQKRISYEGIFQHLIQLGVDSGDLRVLDVKFASYAALGMANWICQLYRPSGRLSLEEVMNLCLEIIFYGLSANRPCTEE